MFEYISSGSHRYAPDWKDGTTKGGKKRKKGGSKARRGKNETAQRFIGKGRGKPRVREPVSFRSCCQRPCVLRLHSLFVRRRRHPPPSPSLPLSRGRGEEGGSNERSLLGRARQRTRRVDLHPLCVISLRY